MKREIKILIEDEGPLAEPGHLRVAVTEQDDHYRMHSASKVYLTDGIPLEALHPVIGNQVAEFLEARS